MLVASCPPSCVAFGVCIAYKSCHQVFSIMRQDLNTWLKLRVWMQVAWQKSEAVQQVWRAVVALLAYPHLWVRKAAGRLVGLLLSTAKLGTA